MGWYGGGMNAGAWLFMGQFRVRTYVAQRTALATTRRPRR